MDGWMDDGRADGSCMYCGTMLLITCRHLLSCMYNKISNNFETNNKQLQTKYILQMETTHI